MMPSLIVLALIGLAAQLVDGSLGMAYGVTSSTLLVAWGISPAMSSASVHLAEVGTTLLSGASHWKFGNIDWRVVVRLGVPGAVGAYAGATVLSNISTELARPVMAGVLLVLGVVVLVRFAVRGVGAPRSAGNLRTRFLAPLGLIAGFVDATGGGGWGPVATPTLLISGKTEVRKVIGSVSASEFLVAVAASLGFLFSLGSEGVNWAIAGALLVGGAIAAPFAAWVVSHVTPRDPRHSRGRPHRRHEPAHHPQHDRGVGFNETLELRGRRDLLGWRRHTGCARRPERRSV